MMATDLATALALGQVGQSGQAARTQRALAERLIGGATSGKPIYSPWAALAQGLTGGVGGYMAADADEREKQERNAAIAEVLSWQERRQQAQRDEVAGITQGNPVAPGEYGPARPALQGDDRINALAALAPNNPAAAAQLSVDQTREQREFQRQMAEDQRRQAAAMAAQNRATQLEIAQMQIGARQPDELTRLFQAAGVQPGSPEAQAFARGMLERRGQPPQTTVNLPQPEGARMRADTATLQQVNEGRGQASTLINMFDRAEQAIRAVPEGQGAQFLPIIGQTARSLGFDIPGTSEAEVLRGITNQLAGLQRIPGSGATTDFEMRLFMQSVPRLGNTREGNLMLVDMGRRLAQRRLDEANIWRRHAGSEDLFDRLEALGPVFSREERDFLEKGGMATPAAAPGEVQNPRGNFSASPPPQPVRVNTPDEARRLPSGTPIILPDGSMGRVP